MTSIYIYIWPVICLHFERSYKTVLFQYYFFSLFPRCLIYIYVCCTYPEYTLQASLEGIQSCPKIINRNWNFVEIGKLQKSFRGKQFQAVYMYPRNSFEQVKALHRSNFSSKQHFWSGYWDYINFFLTFLLTFDLFLFCLKNLKN